MRRSILFMMLVLAMLATTNMARAQKAKESKVVESQRITTPNPEVAKLKEAVNDKKKPLKGAGPQRGLVYGDDYCDVIVDNYTDLYIKVWVDGNYQGIVKPYGKITVPAVPGKTKLYCRADYTDGSYAYWDPPKFDCSWEYTWKLN